MPSLFLPTSHEAFSQANARQLAKGQIYNLDLDEYIGFQFNPTAFEWARQIGWAETIWQGDDRGGDLLFTHIGPRKFEVSLLYMADPGSPDFTWSVPERLSNSDVKSDFQALRKALERWEKKLDGRGRPSRVRVIVGPNYFDGVMTQLGFKITEFFEDLSAREALVSLEFREWLPLKNS
jgi:hypothetical protein